MARPPASPEHRARERDRLRAAAAEIHRDEGIEAVTVRSVTRLAGVSPGALYNSFASIHELLRSLWLEPVLENGEQLAELAAEHPDPVDRLRALLTAFAEFVADHPEIHHGAMLHVRPPGTAPADPRDVSTLPFFALVREAIVAGQADGAIRPGAPDRLAQLAWSAMHGALALPVNAELFDLVDGPNIAVDMVDLVLDALRAD